MRPESKRVRAQTADGPRRRFQHPRPFFIDAKLSVHWAVREPQSLNRAFGAIQNAVVYFVREARGGHVEGLFKIRPFERVRFVEYPENSELSPRE